MKKIYSILGFILLFASCNFFKKTEEGIPIARVNEVYLYQEDIADIVPEGASESDSIQLINAFINRWARQHLLMDGALLNLPEEKQDEYQKLVEQYKNDLYTKAYLEALVKKNIDTVVPVEEAQQFYETNKESFKLNDELIKLRYVNIAQNTNNIEDIEERFKRFDGDDKLHLDSIAIQFKSYSLNDSVWVKASDVAKRVPVISTENRDELLKKSNFIQLKDSLNLYLIQVMDVRLRNDYAPLEYVEPSINQIVINKRKLELIKQLENDITKDAVRNKQFEIYNKTP
ncbi:MAG: peptidyl-prolyl cis-trans isomerase [Bacteroidota bacterium]